MRLNALHIKSVLFNFLAFVCLGVFVLGFNAPSALAVDLVVYDGAVDDTNNIGSSNQLAQGFKIPAQSTITGFKLKGSRGLSYSGSFLAQICEGGTGPANCTVIKSERFNTGVLPPYTANPVLAQVDFATSTGELVGGTTQYYLIITLLEGSETDEMRWSIHYSSDGYADGSRWYGVIPSWSNATAQDENFAIVGSLYSAPESTTSTSTTFVSSSSSPLEIPVRYFSYFFAVVPFVLLFALVRHLL